LHYSWWDVQCVQLVDVPPEELVTYPKCMSQKLELPKPLLNSLVPFSKLKFNLFLKGSVAKCVLLSDNCHRLVLAQTPTHRQGPPSGHWYVHSHITMQIMGAVYCTLDAIDTHLRGQQLAPILTSCQQKKHHVHHLWLLGGLGEGKDMWSLSTNVYKIINSLNHRWVGLDSMTSE
jgi:hypothetical protein